MLILLMNGHGDEDTSSGAKVCLLNEIPTICNSIYYYWKWRKNSFPFGYYGI